MINMLKMNLPEIILIGFLFIYTWNLVRADRINTRIGVGWLLGLAALAILCLLSWPVPQILTRLGRGLPLLGMAILGLAWLALLIINNHVRISSLTVKVKLLDQELALLQERLDRSEKGQSRPLPVRELPSRPEAQDTAPVESVITPAPTSWAKNISRQIVGCAWIVGTIYAFGVFTGFIPPQGTIGEVLTSLFTSLQAEYLH